MIKNRIKQSILLVAIAIVVNAVLAGIKMYVGLSANSLCIILDASNSFLDILTAVVTLAVFIALLFPKSKNAPYGYGRGEYLAGFVVSVVAVVVGGLFFMRSINRIAMPEPVWFSTQNCVLICVSVPIKLGIGLAYYFANKKICSVAIKAIMLDSFLDVGVTSISVVSFSVASKIDYAVDAIFGIVISIIIVIVAIKMVIDNIKSIVIGDGAVKEREAIEKLCKEENVEIRSIALHDYGYKAKVGNVYVAYDGEDKQEYLHKKTLDIVGADVVYLREQEQQPALNQEE